ncbi:hypothetical protein Tco_0677355 [Tanacetum coccineum]|uniref:Uncharacterized protein n=1 Tax=Tanacetum coccineum TaxID=301880 RepID=A0ABQ4XDA4_9ASTR
MALVQDGRDKIVISRLLLVQEMPRGREESTRIDEIYTECPSKRSAINEVRKKEQAYNEEQYSAARRRMLYIPFVDEDDSILLRDIIVIVESLINRDTSIVHSSKIDPILEEFAGELAHIAPIPPGIVEANFYLNDDTSSNDDSFENERYVMHHLPIAEP